MQHLKKLLGGQKLPEEKVLYDFLKNCKKRGHEDRQDFRLFLHDLVLESKSYTKVHKGRKFLGFLFFENNISVNK